MNTSTDTVKRFYTSLLSGDAAGATALLAPDVVLHVPGRHPLAGDYHGREGLARFAAQSLGATHGGERLALLDVLAGDTFVAALCRVEAQRPDRAATLDNRTLHLARVESGHIAEIWFHNFDQHAVDAFWGAHQ
jgi:ketosteroid isomerase-like protein